MSINSRWNTKANDSNAVKNKSAVVVYGQTGSFVTSAFNKDLTGRIDSVISNGRIGPVAGGSQTDFNNRIQVANSNIAYNSRYEGAHQLIMFLSATIGGLANNFVKFASTKRFRSILFRETTRTINTTGLTLNAYTGQWTGTPTVLLDEFKQFGGTLSDDAAHPTRAIPGEFVVIIGDTTNPELKDYEARTG